MVALIPWTLKFILCPTFTNRNQFNTYITINEKKIIVNILKNNNELRIAFLIIYVSNKSTKYLYTIYNIMNSNSNNFQLNTEKYYGHYKSNIRGPKMKEDVEKNTWCQ